MNHLNDIAARHRTSRTRDAIFAVGSWRWAFLVSATTLSTAAQAASRHTPATHVASR